MIISHKHKYVFVEVPHTASTAISSELRKHYDGAAILHKHATLKEFLSSATKEEKGYFVFGGVRHPMDVVVTRYFKRKTNHNNFFEDPKYWRRNGGHVSELALREYQFIKEHSASFSDYFCHFYKWPFDAFGSPLVTDFNYIVRFENLQTDFSKVLTILHIEAIRPLPVVNSTHQRQEHHSKYFEVRAMTRAVRVFGPYMIRWGYEFPINWKTPPPSFLSKMVFSLLSVVRRRRQIVLHNPDED